MTSAFAQTLLDAHPALAPTLPGARLGWLADARRALLDQFAAAGLPAANDEAWKYTGLKALSVRRLAPLPVPVLEEDQLAELASRIDLGADGGARLVFVDGHFHPGLSRLDAGDERIRVERLASALDNGADGLCVLFAPGPERRERFDALNAAFAADGVVIRVAPGARIAAPVTIVQVHVATAVEGFWALRQRIALGAGAALSVIEQHLALGAARHLGSVSTQIDLDAGATLSLLRVGHPAERAARIADTRCTLAADAHLALTALDFGAAPDRHALTVELAGDRAAVEIGQALLLSGRRHADLQLAVHHRGRDTRSDVLARGVADQRGRGVFRGALIVAAGADGADAALSSKNLLLSADAEIDTQPVLEIDADEVKAAHGATVGQLDPVALFYLRSRGVPENTARRMLTLAFCREALRGEWSPELLARLESMIAAALPEPQRESKA